LNSPPPARQITYTDEFVNFLRLTYYAVQLGTLLLAYIVIRNKVCVPSPVVEMSMEFGPAVSTPTRPHMCVRPSQIIAKNDKTKIFLPPVVNPFASPEVCGYGCVCQYCGYIAPPNANQAQSPLDDRGTRRGPRRARTTSTRWTRWRSWYAPR
jgi:hypothetical protein